MPAIAILPLDDPRWRAFVDHHPVRTPFHDPAWAQLVADCYGFDAFGAALTGADGQLRAGAPMVAVRRLGGRPRWVSLPFTDYCPPLAASPTDEAELARGCWPRRARPDWRASSCGRRSPERRPPARRHCVMCSRWIRIPQSSTLDSMHHRCNATSAERSARDSRSGGRRSLVIC